MVYNQRMVPVTYNNDRFEGYWALRRGIGCHRCLGGTGD